MMKRLLLVGVLVLVLVLAMALPALATGGGPQGKLVLNVTYKVTNDEDSGFVGYWALDDYNRHVQVWQTGPTSFYVVGSYTGEWHTFAGALSPMAGVTQGADASGSMEGGYTGTFDYAGVVNPDGRASMGNIGVYDFGGTKVDVLLGTFGAGQTGPTTAHSVLADYFPGYPGVTYIDWGWTYGYQDQVWVNAMAGSSGDVVIP